MVMHPKFAVLEKLDVKEIEIDIELGQAKWRYTVMGHMIDEKDKRKCRERERNETGIGDKHKPLEQTPARMRRTLEKQKKVSWTKKKPANYSTQSAKPLMVEN